MFPFHLWLPEAHVEAPTEGSILLAGLLLKLGGYGFIKILVSYFPVACIYYTPLVFGMCITSIILTSFEAIVQHDFKRLIAYTSVSHMNFAVLGIFSGTLYGLVGAVVLMLAHGLVSSGLFACVGMIYERYSSRQIEYFGGLIIGMPLLGTFFFIILLGNFGFPLTFNFIGELLILVGLAHTNLLIFFLTSIGLFLSVVYSILLYNKLMFGNVKPFIRKIKDVTLFEFNSLLSLSLASIFFWNLAYECCGTVVYDAVIDFASVVVTRLVMSKFSYCWCYDNCGIKVLKILNSFKSSPIRVNSDVTIVPYTIYPQKKKFIKKKFMLKNEKILRQNNCNAPSSRSL